MGTYLYVTGKLRFGRWEVQEINTVIIEEGKIMTGEIRE
jgi:hypothetical protein